MENARPAFDFLILADRAEVVGGKLYMMGGGWETMRLPSLAEHVVFGVAAGVIVPWLATNVEHLLALRVEDADARQLVEARIGFKTGRPPAIEHGASQRVMFTLPINLLVPAPGRYVVVGVLGDEEQRTVFHVQVASPGA